MDERRNMAAKSFGERGQAMRLPGSVVSAIRRRLHIRPDAEDGTALFWSAEGMVPRPWTAWVDAEEGVADELQFYSDHFTAADKASGLTYVTQVVEGGE
jgi:hypothetical protein